MVSALPGGGRTGDSGASSEGGWFDHVRDRVVARPQPRHQSRRDDRSLFPDEALHAVTVACHWAAVLHQIYAKVIFGQEASAKRRIEAAPGITAAPQTGPRIGREYSF